MNKSGSGLLRLALRITFAYRAAVVATLATVVVEIFLLRKIWTAVYGGQGSVDGLSLNALIVYLTLANLQSFAMTTTIIQTVHHRIRSGAFFFDFVRPAGYLRQMIDLQVGSTAGRLIMLLPAIPVAFMVGSISAPTNVAAATGYVVSLVLGYGIGVLLSLLVGLSAFWTLEIGGMDLFYRLISHFLSGAMVPLTFFPGPLRTLADRLPFRFLGFVPASIYVGTIFRHRNGGGASGTDRLAGGPDRARDTGRAAGTPALGGAGWLTCRI